MVHTQITAPALLAPTAQVVLWIPFNAPPALSIPSLDRTRKRIARRVQQECTVRSQAFLRHQDCALLDFGAPKTLPNQRRMKPNVLLEAPVPQVVQHRYNAQLAHINLQEERRTVFRVQKDIIVSMDLVFRSHAHCTATARPTLLLLFCVRTEPLTTTAPSWKAQHSVLLATVRSTVKGVNR